MELPWSIYTHTYTHIYLKRRYRSQEGDAFEFSNFSQNRKIKSFPIKKEGFDTGDAPKKCVSFIITIINLC